MFTFALKYMKNLICFVLLNQSHGELQSDEDGLKERGQYFCSDVYVFSQICTDGTDNYPPRLNVKNKPNETLEYEAFGELKNDVTLYQDDYLVLPNGDAYFFVDRAGGLNVFNKDTRQSHFIFSGADQVLKKIRGFGVFNGPFKVQYKEGKLKIFKAENSQLLQTLHLHNFDNKNSAKKSRLTLGNDNILKIKVDNTVVWSSNALRRKQILKHDQSIFSQNGKFQCSINDKCQFVVRNRKTNLPKKTYGDESDDKINCELRASDSSNLSLKIVDPESDSTQKTFPLTNKSDRKMFVCPNSGVPNL